MSERDNDRNQCNRCGDDFRTELCVVYEGEPVTEQDRNRIEAYLCYNCRQEVTHERLGVTDGGKPVEGTDHPLVGDVYRCEQWDEMYHRERLQEYGGDCPWCGQSVETDT